MDHTFAKFAALDSTDKLRGIHLPGQTVAGGIMGSPDYTILLDPSTKDDIADAVVQNLTALKR